MTLSLLAEATWRVVAGWLIGAPGRPTEVTWMGKTELRTLTPRFVAMSRRAVRVSLDPDWRAGRSLCLSNTPKYSVAHTIGFLKGKSAIRIHRECLGQRRSFSGLHFWAKGYCVSTVGLDEQTIGRYIQNQEIEETRLEQMQLKGLQTLS